MRAFGSGEALLIGVSAAQQLGGSDRVRKGTRLFSLPRRRRWFCHRCVFAHEAVPASEILTFERGRFFLFKQQQTLAYVLRLAYPSHTYHTHMLLFVETQTSSGRHFAEGRQLVHVLSGRGPVRLYQRPDRQGQADRQDFAAFDCRAHYGRYRIRGQFGPAVGCQNP